MSYRGLTIWLFVSAPGDVPSEHLETVRSTLSRWNVNHGRAIAATVIPVAWTEHAVAAFGGRPQGLINEQLTDEVDMGVAIFRNRLGTPTGAAESGTWEEVERLNAAGKPVAVLRDRTPGPGPSGPDGAAELLRLEEHLRDTAFPQGLVLSFPDRAELASFVDAFVTRAVAQLQQRLDNDLTELDVSNGPVAGEDPSRGVWPRVESSEYVETDSKGRIKTKRRWFLVLSNQTGGPVSNVRYEYLVDEGEMFDYMSSGESEPVQTMPPGVEQRWPIALTMGSLDRVQCRVTWEDAAGEHITEATVTT